MTTCFIWFSSIQTAGRLGASSMLTAVSLSCAGRSIKRAVSAMTLFRSTNFFSGGFCRAKSRSLRMMLAQRFVSLITRSISSASALPGGSLSRIRCEKVSTPVSGLLSS